LHRLLKNDVAEKTGVKAYALVTAPAVEALALNELETETKPYTVEISEFGTIKAAVIDMGARWLNNRQHNELVVAESGRLLFPPVSRRLPFPLEVVWQYATDPQLRGRWQDVHGITRTVGDPGRLRAGAVEHCAHGNETIVLEYVDVRPLKHMTAKARMPFGGSMLFSLVTERENEGTRVSVRFAQPGCRNPFARFLLRRMAGLQAGKLRALWEKEFGQLEALLRANAPAVSPASVQLSDAELAGAARALAA
jgi:uncharacterized protein YndB with AHSA1/START domain